MHTWRPPLSSTTREYIPRCGLTAPRFNEDDPLGWIFSIQDYFNYHLISESIRLELVDRLIEYPASSWFYRYQKHNFDGSWEDFLVALRNHFAPELIEDDVSQDDENQLVSHSLITESSYNVTNEMSSRSNICDWGLEANSKEEGKAGDIVVNTIFDSRHIVVKAGDSVFKNEIESEQLVGAVAMEEINDVDSGDDDKLQGDSRHIRGVFGKAVGFPVVPNEHQTKTNFDAQVVAVDSLIISATTQASLHAATNICLVEEILFDGSLEEHNMAPDSRDVEHVVAMADGCFVRTKALRSGDLGNVSQLQQSQGFVVTCAQQGRPLDLFHENGEWKRATALPVEEMGVHLFSSGAATFEARLSKQKLSYICLEHDHASIDSQHKSTSVDRGFDDGLAIRVVDEDNFCPCKEMVDEMMASINDTFQDNIDALRSCRCRGDLLAPSIARFKLFCGQTDIMKIAERKCRVNLGRERARVGLKSPQLLAIDIKKDLFKTLLQNLMSGQDYRIEAQHIQGVSSAKAILINFFDDAHTISPHNGIPSCSPNATHRLVYSLNDALEFTESSEQPCVEYILDSNLVLEVQNSQLVGELRKQVDILFILPPTLLILETGSLITLFVARMSTLSRQDMKQLLNPNTLDVHRCNHYFRVIVMIGVLILQQHPFGYQLRATIFAATLEHDRILLKLRSYSQNFGSHPLSAELASNVNFTASYQLQLPAEGRIYVVFHVALIRSSITQGLVSPLQLLIIFCHDQSFNASAIITTEMRVLCNYIPQLIQWLASWSVTPAFEYSGRNLRVSEHAALHRGSDSISQVPVQKFVSINQGGTSLGNPYSSSYGVDQLSHLGLDVRHRYLIAIVAIIGILLRWSSWRLQQKLSNFLGIVLQL